MTSSAETELSKLYPSIFNARWYVSRQLRKNIEIAINIAVKGKNFKKLIDYGCGISPYKKFFLPHIEEYVGADIKKNKNCQIVLNDDGTIPIKPSSFDIVLSTQVLEHVENPNLYLSESFRLLNNEGIIFLSTHGYWLYHPSPNDFWRWTSEGLKKIFVDNGLEIIYFRGIVGRGASGLYLFQDSFIFKLPRPVVFIFAFIMQCLIWLTDKTTTQATKDYDACDYLVIAKKKLY